MRRDGKRVQVWQVMAVAWSVIALWSVPVAVAQEPLTLDKIFSSPQEFFPQGIGQVRWLDDGTYTTLEPSASGGMDIVRHFPSDDRTQVLVPATMLVPEGGDAPLAIAGYEWSSDRSKLLVFTNTARVWRSNTRGDYWVLDMPARRLRQLGGDAPESSLMYAKFSPDGGRVGYVSENNLYVENLGSGDIVQLTSDGSRTILNGRFDWVYEEEFFLGSRMGADGWRWSPDGERIAYWQLDASGVRDFLLINNTDSLYSYTIPVQYPKAGTTNSAGRMGVVPASGGPTVWMAIDHEPRNNYIARMEWAASPDEIVMQHLNRRQNTLQLMLGNARTGEVRTALTETDSTWVDASDDLLWLDGGARFTWMSERDGWRRMYVVERDGSAMRPISAPGADVETVLVIDGENGWVYYIASPEEPTRRYLYRAALSEPMTVERLTPIESAGWNTYNIAPNGEWAFHTHSTFDTPPVISLVDLPSHAIVRVLRDNQQIAEAAAMYRKQPTEFFRVETEDGVVLDGWMMKPNDFDPSKKYPVLFHVYGGPWGTEVTDRWRGFQGWWFQSITELGYLVISLDNRGTPVPRGREWRKAIYKQDGIISSRDQAMGLKAITATYPFVDPDRVAIWGWSGGGYNTLNALFRYPELYHTGMAVASVPDLRYYDTIYQERYMGLPQDDPEAYAQSSPITFAHQLEGNLLLVHGTGDDNVHYQGVEALINKLVEHNKHFTMMAYPNRSHGIYEGPGTTRHLYGLLTRYLQENLPAGPR